MKDLATRVDLGKNEGELFNVVVKLNGHPVLVRDEHRGGILCGILESREANVTSYLLHTPINGPIDLCYHDLKELFLLTEPINIFGDLKPELYRI